MVAYPARGCLSHIQFCIPPMVVCPACGCLSHYLSVCLSICLFVSSLSICLSVHVSFDDVCVACENLRFPPTINSVRLVNTALLLLLLVLKYWKSACIRSEHLQSFMHTIQWLMTLYTIPKYQQLSNYQSTCVSMVIANNSVSCSHMCEQTSIANEHAHTSWSKCTVRGSNKRTYMSRRFS